MKQRQPPPPLPPHPQQGKPKKKIPVWAWVLIAFFAIGIVGAALNDDEKQTVTKGTEQAATTEAKQTDAPTTAAPETEAPTTEAYIPTVGDTVTVKDVDYTLKSFETSEGDRMNKPDAGHVFFLPLFEVANNSDRDVHISTMLEFSAYADDEAVRDTISAAVASEVKTIGGKVAPGKRVSGVYGLEVPEDWQVIEIHIEPSVWAREPIIFTINRP